MRPTRLINLLLSVIIVIASFAIPEEFSVAHPMQQTGVILTATGTLILPMASSHTYNWSFDFDPAGGPVSGNFKTVYNDSGVTFDHTFTLTGNFEGGDGGRINGNVSTHSVMTGGPNPGSEDSSSTWEGHLYANGTGKGTVGINNNSSWSVTFDGQAFQAALQEATPTATDSPTPTPWDLSVDKILVLQAVEGGRLVAGKPGAARVFLNWPDPQNTAQASVEFRMDGRVIGNKVQVVRNSYSDWDAAQLLNSFNFDIPAGNFTEGAHTFSAKANLVGNGQAALQDPNPANNNLTLSDLPVQATRSINVVLSYTETMSREEIVKTLASFIAKAGPYTTDVYPVPAFNFIPRSFPLRDPMLDSLPANVYLGKPRLQLIALEISRQVYNSKRAPGSPFAGYALGVFPAGYYGPDYHGISYPSDPRDVLVAVDSPESVAHEFGHGLLGSTEEYNLDPGGIGLELPLVTIYQGSKRLLEDLRSRSPYYNFMGAAGMGSAWVNAETWNHLADLLAISPTSSTNSPKVSALLKLPADDQPEDGFLVSGTISSSGAVEVRSVLWLSGMDIQDPGPIQTPYSLEALDTQGNVISDTPISVDTTKTDPAPFLAMLPAPANSGSLVFLNGGQTIATIKRSANPPQVNITSPAGALSGDVEITWKASDPDGDAMTYTLLYTGDDGAWIPLAINLTEPHFTLNTDNLPGCNNCRLQVLASDGWNTVSATADGSFSLANRSPSITIGYPSDGDVIPVGEPVTLLAAAYDPEDGLLTGANIEWRSDRDGVLGTGDRLDLPGLSGGAHTITVTARDSSGAEGQATMKITVVSADGVVTNSTPTPGPNPSPDGSTLLVLAIGAGCLCVVVIVLIVVIVLVTRKKKQPPAAPPYYPPQR